MGDDITRNYHRGNPRSQEAHTATESRKDADYFRILQLLGRQPRGLTCDEAEPLLGMSHQTCSARFSDLKRKGWIAARDDGQGKPVQRRTRSNCWADVMFLVLPPANPYEDLDDD